MALHDILNRADIDHLLDEFYLEARKDELLGPVFEQHIPEAKWPHHLKRISDFWAGVLLHEGDYSGSPFLKHWPLHLKQEHFDRWVSLWKTAIARLFEGEKAKDAATRAEVMGVMFMAKIRSHREAGTTPLH